MLYNPVVLILSPGSLFLPRLRKNNPSALTRNWGFLHIPSKRFNSEPQKY